MIQGVSLYIFQQHASTFTDTCLQKTTCQLLCRAAGIQLSASLHCVSMHAAILEATAEMRAAPRPLPSSDWMNVISQ